MFVLLGCKLSLTASRNRKQQYLHHSLHTIIHPRSPDLIVEVAHPSISAQFGASFLQTADFMVR